MLKFNKFKTIINESNKYDPYENSFYVNEKLDDKCKKLKNRAQGCNHKYTFELEDDYILVNCDLDPKNFEDDLNEAKYNFNVNANDWESTNNNGALPVNFNLIEQIIWNDILSEENLKIFDRKYILSEFKISFKLK